MEARETSPPTTSTAPRTEDVVKPPTAEIPATAVEAEENTQRPEQKEEASSLPSHPSSLPKNSPNPSAPTSSATKVARTFFEATAEQPEGEGAKPNESTPERDDDDRERAEEEEERPAKRFKKDNYDRSSSSQNSEAEDDEGDSENEEGEEQEEGELDGSEAAVGTNEHDDLENPPLPPGPPPGEDDSDDGWQAIWDDQHQTYYFYNAITGISTWTNPRAPPTAQDTGLAPGVTLPSTGLTEDYTTTYPPSGDIGIDALTYDTTNPTAAAVSDDHDPASDPDAYAPTYYQLAHGITDPTKLTAEDLANTMYQSTGTFNRFTGKFQTGKDPEMYSGENKSKRQMEFYFDVDAAANSHDGRSLKAERQMKKLSKKEVKAFREKRKEKKEQKRRAWLKD